MRKREMPQKLGAVSRLRHVPDTDYRDCETCDERYWGAHAQSYLREVEIDGGDSFEYRCTACLMPKKTKAEWIAMFPERFKLKGQHNPSSVFKVNRRSSYFAHPSGKFQIVVQVVNAKGEWKDYCRADVSEVLSEALHLDTLEPVYSKRKANEDVK